MRRTLIPLGIQLVVLAQSQNVLTTSRVEFEVTSVKLHKDASASYDPFVKGRRVSAVAKSLIGLISYAFDVRYDQVSGGPDWASSDYYDIEAKAAEGEGTLSIDQSREMMRSLLADRFRLRVHEETQDAPVYTLVVAKNGPKMKQVPSDTQGGSITRETDKGIRIETVKGTMANLARQLSATAGRPVIDKTGLSGYYAFTLVWFPANRIPAPDVDAPSMVAALREQLGLWLESSKGPTKKVIVDHVQRLSEN